MGTSPSLHSLVHALYIMDCAFLLPQLPVKTKYSVLSECYRYIWTQAVSQADAAFRCLTRRNCCCWEPEKTLHWFQLGGDAGREEENTLDTV